MAVKIVPCREPGAVQRQPAVHPGRPCCSDVRVYLCRDNRRIAPLPPGRDSVPYPRRVGRDVPDAPACPVVGRGRPCSPRRAGMDRLSQPGTQPGGQVMDNPGSQVGEETRPCQRVETGPGLAAGVRELEVSGPPVPFRALVPLPAPELRDAEEGVRPLNQAAEWAWVRAPRGVEVLTIVLMVKSGQVEQPAELDVLKLVYQRHR